MKWKFALTIYIIILGNVFSQEIQPIYEVKIMKFTNDGKKSERKEVTVAADGKIYYKKIKDVYVHDLNVFTKGINNLIRLETKVTKVPGDNEKRTIGIQEPYKMQNIYVKVIFANDWNNEQDLKNKTYSVYRETNLSSNEINYDFYKYLESDDVLLIRNLLE